MGEDAARFVHRSITIDHLGSGYDATTNQQRQLIAKRKNTIDVILGVNVM